MRIFVYMFASFMHLLPCFTCLALLLICLLTYRKGQGGRMIAFTAIFAVFFLADSAYYTLDIHPITWVAMDMVSQFVSLWVVPFTVGSIEAAWTQRRPRHRHFWRYIPGYIIGLFSIVLYWRCGFARITEFIETVKANDSLLPMDADWGMFLFYCNNIFGSRFIFLFQTALAIFVLSRLIYRSRKEPGLHDSLYTRICLLMMLAFVLISTRYVFGRFYMLTNQLLSAIISALIGCLFIALGILLFKSRSSEASQEGVTADENASSIESLKAKFTTYIEQKKPYLAPDYTLERAAADLGTNRTYLSILVNSLFGKTFREYINTLRVTYAKEYILSHKAERLEDVALASGFHSGAQFSRKFKEIEGQTPNAWIRSRMI